MDTFGLRKRCRCPRRIGRKDAVTGGTIGSSGTATIIVTRSTKSWAGTSTARPKRCAKSRRFTTQCERGGSGSSQRPR
jgi:hypothetical protein